MLTTVTRWLSSRLLPGVDILIKIRTTAFEPCLEFKLHQEAHAKSGSYGAAALFVGTMRDLNEDVHVQAMSLEHYPGMTEKYLREISAQARRRWTIQDTLIVHRVGEVLPGDPIVLVAVWSAHRGPAFDACRYIVEELKSHAPFWKKETLSGNSTRWVERNTPAA